MVKEILLFLEEDLSDLKLVCISSGILTVECRMIKQLKPENHTVSGESFFTQVKQINKEIIPNCWDINIFIAYYCEKKSRGILTKLLCKTEEILS